MAVRAIGNYVVAKRITTGDESVDGRDEQDANAASGIDAEDERGANSADSAVDPASIPTAGDDAPYGYTKSGRRRNRPIGSNRTGAGKSGRKSASETSSSLNSILFSVHLMGASFLKVPELTLTNEESEALCEAIMRVTELYDIPLVDEKTMAWVNLAMVAGGIYAPRFIAAKINKSKQGNLQVINNAG